MSMTMQLHISFKCTDVKEIWKTDYTSYTKANGYKCHFHFNDGSVYTINNLNLI